MSYHTTFLSREYVDVRTLHSDYTTNRAAGQCIGSKHKLLKC